MAVSPARAVAYDILLRVESSQAYAVELLHAGPLEKLSLPDRNLCTEIVMGVLRWRSRIDARIAAASAQSLGKLDLEVLTALRMADYQLEFLDRVPSSAAVNESVELVKRARKRSAVPFANAVLRKLCAEPPQPAIGKAGSAGELAGLYAHPLWLVERWVAKYGFEAARAICEQNQKVPGTALRLTGSSRDVDEQLNREGIVVAPGALLASARRVVSGDITRSEALRAGKVQIQDEASQLVAALVGKGERILDCCAAPGNKTAAVAERNQAAHVIAAELHPARARLLRRLLRDQRVDVVAADATALPFANDRRFDRVLADVPCSGTGTLGRNPEIKWRLAVSDLSDLHARQVNILSAILEFLKPGGRAIYSTCSLEGEENEDVVSEVMERMQAYRLVLCGPELQRLKESGELVGADTSVLTEGPYLRTLPGVHPCDGFFAAIIERI